LNLLEDNFKEIYHTIKFPHYQPLSLVANLTGTRIYDSRYGWGRLWCWFYKAFDFITDYPWQNRKLKQAILHTHTLFLKTLTNIELHLNTYKEYLNKLGKGYIVTEDFCVEARDQITKWNNATNSFYKQLRKTNSKNNLVNLFQTSFDKKAPKIKAFCDIQKIIDLEGCCGSPVPLFAIKRILRNIPLNTIDQKEIGKWVAKINKYKVPIEIVHKALKAIANFYTSKNNTKTAIQDSLYSLEFFIEEKGCAVFHLNDQKHLKWRQNLQKGNIIHMNHAMITLGNEIFPKLSGSNQTRAYLIQEMPNHIALIAHNRCALPLRNLHMRQTKNLGIQSAHFTEISLDGRVALMERMTNVSELRWTSNNNTISSEDRQLVEGITKLVKELIKHNVTPANLSSSLMLDEKLQFKCVKPTIMQPFDFNVVEDYIYGCSGGNTIIFQTLMVQSGLINQPAAKFYKDIVSNTLKDEKIVASDLAAIYKIGDSKIVDRATVLSNQIKSEKKKLLLKLSEMHPKWYLDQLNTEANKVILQKYLHEKRCSTFE
jgi:hypothetical protein